jgi:uncharacterized protein (DUF1684 family)
MTVARDRLALAEWRRETAGLYLRVRTAPAGSVDAWHEFRSARDRLFRDHPQSPLTAVQRRHFTRLDYHPYDGQARVIGEVQELDEGGTVALELPAEGLLRYTKIANVHFTLYGIDAALPLYWIEGYGGGLFLPFGDSSNGKISYGGGRYLYDTIKGADLGARSDRIVLDFNYAYNPSCAYNPRWVCPLPPTASCLPFSVAAGELAFRQNSSATSGSEPVQTQ